jgi:hypothetical protein
MQLCSRTSQSSADFRSGAGIQELVSATFLSAQLGAVRKELHVFGRLQGESTPDSTFYYHAISGLSARAPALPSPEAASEQPRVAAQLTGA